MFRRVPEQSINGDCDMAATKPPLKIIRRKVVEDRTGYTRSTIYSEMAVGRFPKQIKLGPRSVGWLEEDIEEWIAARVAEAKGGAQ